MKRSAAFALGLQAIFLLYIAVLPEIVHSDAIPKSVKIVAPPNESFVMVYQEPSRTSEALTRVLGGNVFSAVSIQGDFYEIKMHDQPRTGFVLLENAEPFIAKTESVWTPIFIGLGVGVALLGAVGALLYLKFKKEKEHDKVIAQIPASLKAGEEFFRSGDYLNAAKQFNQYISLQGGDIRNADVYRRLAVCHQQTGDIREAVKCWQNIRDLEALTPDDYVLGVELKLALGRHSEAADIYEQLLAAEEDPDKKLEIHKKLIDIYRRLKSGAALIRHTLALKEFEGEKGVVAETAGFLLMENETDLAIESNDKELITTICRDMLEDKMKNSEAERIYLKCLSYDRTDKRLHRMLADIYTETGEYKKAVSEFSILSQIDKDQADTYMEQAAKIYLESSKVSEAVFEGNPGILKKIAQQYLVRSEVHPDAVAVYERIIEFQPRAVGINRMLSTVYLTQGKLDKYMDKLRLLHEIDGSNHDYLSELAACIIDNDLIDDALKEGNKELNTRILKQLVKKGTTNDRAVALLEKLIQVDTENLNVLIALAKAYDKREEYEKSFTQYIAVLHQKPQDQNYITRTAELAADRGFLARILPVGLPALTDATAFEIVNRELTGPDAFEILREALRNTPHDRRIRDYLQASEFADMDSASQSHHASPPPPAPPPAPPAPPAQPARPRATGSSAGATLEISGDLLASAETTQNLTRGRIEKGKKTGTLFLKKKPPQPPVGSTTKEIRPPVGSTTKEIRRAPEDVTEKKAVQTAPKQAATPSVPPPERKPAPPSPPKPARTQPAPPAPKKPSPPSPAPAKEQSPPPVKEAKPFPGQPPQSVKLTDFELSGDKAITTFVSGYAQGQALRDFPRHELFLPETGGLAYKEMELLYSDGWGEMHAGAEVNTNRPVLMRIFRKDLLDAQSMQEFVNEVSDISWNIVHNHIIRLEEVVRGPGGRIALVHPYYAHTLETMMRLSRGPDTAQKIELMVQLVRGLAYAHDYKRADGNYRRTYHLHIQPGNIFVNDDFNFSVVAGLGFSQIYRNLTLARKSRWQEPGVNPVTLPPEFFRLKTSSINEKSADVYSLGVVMYFVMTGDYPFEGPTFDEYKFQHTKIYPAPPRLIKQEIPEWLDRIIVGCLEKTPEKRWESLSVVAQAFAKNLQA